MIDTFKKGYNSPEKVLPFVLGQVVPSPLLDEAQQYSPKWEWNREEGFITFTAGGFAGGTQDRPEFSARNYYEISQLERILESLDPPFEQSAEIGAGYGRLSPWIAEFADTHYGIEPNRTQLERANDQYPGCKWVEATAQDLHFEDDCFDLVVSWTVLQHIPDEHLRPALRQLERILTRDGYLVCCEETKGEPGVNTFPRSVETYERLFSSLTLEATYDRQMEPTYQGGQSTVMVFTAR